MKEKKTYSLGEAIKQFHKTEPLKIDLANTVANKVFVKAKMPSVILENWLYVFVAVIVVGGLIYSFSLFSNDLLPLYFLFLIPVACYFGFSVKEYWVMSKRLLSAE